MENQTVTLEQFHSDERYSDVKGFIGGREIESISAGWLGTVYDGIWRVWFTDSDVCTDHDAYTLVEVRA